MKKTALAIILGAMTLTNTALANYTENLQYRFSNKKLSVEYVQSDFRKVHYIKPTKNIFKDPEQLTRWAVIDSDKFIFATSNGNQYFQHDYAVGVFDQKNFDFVGVKYVSQEEAINDDNALNYSSMNEAEWARLPFKVSKSILGLNLSKNNDVNIIANGNVYSLNRKTKKGYYSSLDQLDMQKQGRYLVCHEMAVPNAINTLLLKHGNNKLTYLGSEWVNIDGAALQCESYMVENLQEGQINRPYRLKMYYNYGELKYFSHILEEGEIDGYEESIAFERMKDPATFAAYRPLLFKVVKLSSQVDESLFNSYSNYELQQAPLK